MENANAGEKDGHLQAEEERGSKNGDYSENGLRVEEEKGDGEKGEAWVEEGNGISGEREMKWRVLG